MILMAINLAARRSALWSGETMDIEDGHETPQLVVAVGRRIV
mgnify:CR=1 FL=1